MSSALAPEVRQKGVILVESDRNTALATLLGLYHGYLSGTGLGTSTNSVVAVFGLVFSVFVLVALAAAFVVRLRAEWARIAVRVAGSWIAAGGLLGA
jgi:hydrogenase/urease accessory protein HupE